MSRLFERTIKIFLTIIFGISFISLNAICGMPEKDYLAALKIADEAVARKKAMNASPSSLSSSMLKTLFGRYYQVGDKWNVASWQIQSSMMRMTGNPDSLKDNVSNVGIFHYEVLNVKTGFNPEVTIRVTQVKTEYSEMIDPKVSQLILKMNDQMMQSEKTYYFFGNPVGTKVSPEGIHSSISFLDLYPLDVPEVSTAQRVMNPSLPVLPPAIQSFVSRMGFKPDLAQSSWLDQDDFFGRPIQILWQHGDPWPAYFKTSGGISILIGKGAL